jgi:uncharacterized protein YyaL (SSP411 family)
MCNALHVFELTQESFFREVAEELLDYLEDTFRDPLEPFYHGCRDYIRIFPGRDLPAGVTLHKTKGMFSLADRWMYTDANARTVCAYLRASRTLGRKDCADRALETLRFLQERCHDDARGMAHYFDGEPRLWGLLTDQVCVGLALVEAFGISNERVFLENAEALAAFIQVNLKNLEGGFFDIAEKGPAHLRYPLTLLTENGAAALFFVRLHDLTKKQAYRDAASWAFRCFTGDFTAYGLHAAEYGLALQAYVDSGR